jgi:two-component system cell cycle response regulator
MSLRVLLADESTTIKKVMLLALQDFAVEVKAVHAGVDVLEVARTFNPDIIFADILLQKRNGYEVAQELKNDANLAKIPVVLMWSSFMDFDDKLAKAARVDGRLEKPFDVETLRQLILSLVPTTQSQRLAHFLQYPDSIAAPLKNEVRDQEEARYSPQPHPHPQPPTQSANSSPVSDETAPAVTEPKIESGWTMDSFDDIGKFASKDITDAPTEPMEIQHPPTPKSTKSTPAAPRTITHPAADEGGEAWSHQDLTRFKIDLPPATAETDEYDMEIDLSKANFSESDFMVQDRSAKPPPANFDSHTLSIDTPIEPVHFETEPFKDNFADQDDSDDEELKDSFENIPLSMSDDDRPLSLVSSPEREREKLRVVETKKPRAPLDDIPSANGPIQQMSADRLESIVRAQSKEIIEALVRKIVPDLASEMIRAELERLLEESASR